MGSRTCDFDAEQTSDAKQESEYTSDKRAPEENSAVPILSLRKLYQACELSGKEHDGSDHNS